MKNEFLHHIKSFNYLGVDIDYTLSFDAMIDHMYTKVNRKLYSLKIIRPYITNSIANVIYKSCVWLILEYVVFLVNSCAKSKTEKLDCIQKMRYYEKGAKTPSVSYVQPLKKPSYLSRLNTLLK